jgi:hypothetical protein
VTYIATQLGEELLAPRNRPSWATAPKASPVSSNARVALIHLRFIGYLLR